MFGPILKGAALASTPTGRRLIRQAIRFARSDQGRKFATKVRTTATSPENQQRMKAAAKLLRERAGR